jgi:response regulator NasT
VIADDNAELRRYFVQSLLQLGHEVAGVAENGQELIEQCQAQHPDVAITDIQMPVMDGLEAIREISKESMIPFIVVSAQDMPEESERGVGMPIIERLRKPFLLEDLETALARVS